MFEFINMKKQLLEHDVLTGKFRFSIKNIDYDLLLKHEEKKVNNYRQDVCVFIFIKVRSRDVLPLKSDVEGSLPRNFSREQYKKLKDFFGIEYNPSGPVFIPSELFKQIDELLKYKKNNPNATRSELAIEYQLDNPAAIYYYGSINWNEEKNKGKGNATKKNKEKVQKLIPELYEQIKHENISIKFTDSDKNDNRWESEY